MKNRGTAVFFKCLVLATVIGGGGTSATVLAAECSGLEAEYYFKEGGEVCSLNGEWKQGNGEKTDGEEDGKEDTGKDDGSSTGNDSGNGEGIMPCGEIPIDSSKDK